MASVSFLFGARVSWVLVSRASQTPSKCLQPTVPAEHEPTCWGLRPRNPAPCNIFMPSKRDRIRWFISEVRWATPRNVTYFIEGRCDEALNRVYSSELSEMRREKDKSLRLKLIRNQDGKSAYTMSTKPLPTFMFNHDSCLRDVVGKFLHGRGMLEVSLKKPSDATILHYCFELDNGHMDDSQIERKLLNHYTRTRVQVVFIMRHREFPHLEEKRLKKVFEISERLFLYKPNKVLGTCYTKYLEDGLLYNRKGQVMKKAM